MEGNSTFYDKLGFTSHETSENSFLLELPLQTFLLQEEDKIHPGALSTMLDIAMGSIISKKYKAFATTINLNLTFFNLAPKECYRAKTRILDQKDQYVTAEGIVFDQEQILVAKAVGTFKIKPGSY